MYKITSKISLFNSLRIVYDKDYTKLQTDTTTQQICAIVATRYRLRKLNLLPFRIPHALLFVTMLFDHRYVFWSCFPGAKPKLFDNFKQIKKDIFQANDLIRERQQELDNNL